jgi:hypothetical protein
MAEIFSPGLIFPGVIGGSSLLLGFYALGILPVDYAGILLLVLAVRLSIAELFTASFGLLTACGIVALIVSSLILLKGGTLFRINPALIAVVAVVVAAFLVFVIAKVVGAHCRQASTGREEMLISVLPRTSLGRWSVSLAIAFILFLVLMEVTTGFNLFGPGFNPVLAVVLAIILVGTSGAAFVSGLISVIKHKERSVLVFVSMAITLWVGLLGAVGEFLI